MDRYGWNVVKIKWPRRARPSLDSIGAKEHNMFQGQSLHLGHWGSPKEHLLKMFSFVGIRSLAIFHRTSLSLSLILRFQIDSHHLQFKDQEKRIRELAQ